MGKRVAVRAPRLVAAEIDLDHRNAGLDEAAGQQAARTEQFAAITILDSIGFAAVEQPCRRQIRADALVRGLKTRCRRAAVQAGTVDRNSGGSRRRPFVPLDTAVIPGSLLVPK